MMTRIVPAATLRPFPIERQHVAFAALALDGIRASIERLNAVHKELGCVIFPARADTENVLVIFAGFLEKFFLLGLAQDRECEVIYLQDPYSQWFGGSEILPNIEDLCRDFLIAQVGARRPIFFGQSSGAYASLVAAKYFDDAIAVACGPQTFADGFLKDRVKFVGGIRPMRAPADIISISDHWMGVAKKNRVLISIFGVTEYDNPASKFIWMDQVHLNALISNEIFDIFVIPVNRHSLVQGNRVHFHDLVGIICENPSENVRDLAAAFLAKTFKQ
jgi:hypothetical protein